MKTEKKVNYMNLSNKNKFIILRNEHNLTQEQVAEMLNISKSTYCRIETGQQNISVEALKELLKIYNITFEDFYNIKLPIVRTITYPDKLLKNLQNALNENEEKSNSWIVNFEKFEKLKKALKPILEIRDKALALPDIDISEMPDKTTIKQVTFNRDAELLIDRAIEAQQKLLEPN